MINFRLVKPLFVFCLLPIAICALLSSCHDKVDTLDIDYKYSYFPLDTGHYVTYDVDSILSDNSNGSKDTFHYQLKMLVADTFMGLNNELNYRIELYRRPDGLSPWLIDRVWSAKKTLYNVQLVEDDIRFIKLVFPPTLSGSWNGNLYIPTTDPYRDFQNWNYYYESVDVPYTLAGFGTLDSTLTVSEVDDQTFISERLRKEVYARGIGMIYQEWDLKTGQGGIANGAWQGFSIRMRMIDHN